MFSLRRAHPAGDALRRKDPLNITAQADRLLKLAQARTAGDRERLLLAIADLCESADNAGALDTQAVQALLNDIVMRLVVGAEPDVRRRLAETLARALWPPRALIGALALDDIEIARPVIALSPLMQDRELIRLLVEASVEHQIEAARRPNIGPLVVDAILTQEEPAVLTALACNDSAGVSADGMQRLVAVSRRIPALRPPLVRHPRLTASLAEQLHAWVGPSLKAALAARFDSVAGGPGERPASKPTPAPSGELQENARRLVAKLHDAGQLRPSFLLRALREGDLLLFEAAMARLGGFSHEEIHLAISCGQPELLALACVAVGVDRSVFPTLLGLVRELSGGRPSGDTEAANQAFGGFAGHPRTAAAIAFRHALAAV